MKKLAITAILSVTAAFTFTQPAFAYGDSTQYVVPMSDAMGLTEAEVFKMYKMALKQGYVKVDAGDSSMIIYMNMPGGKPLSRAMVLEELANQSMKEAKAANAP